MDGEAAESGNCHLGEKPKVCAGIADISFASYAKGAGGRG